MVSSRSIVTPGRARRWSSAGRQFAVVVGLFGLWAIGSWSGGVPATTFPAPWVIAGDMIELVNAPELWSAVGATALSWAVGLALAAVVAVPLGLAIGSNDLMYRSTRFTVDFVRTIPPVALVPLALLMYGTSLQMKLVLIVFGASWPLLLQSMYGVHQVDRVVRDTAHSYRLRRRDRVLRVVVPAAAPFVATGLRIAATMALLLSIGAELIGGANGLGESIALAQTAGDLPRMYSFIIVSAVFGVLINAGLGKAERRVLAWHAPNRQGRRA